MESIDDCSAGLVVEQSHEYPLPNDPSLALTCSKFVPCESSLLASNQNEDYSSCDNPKVPDCPLEDRQELSPNTFSYPLKSTLPTEEEELLYTNAKLPDLNESDIVNAELFGDLSKPKDDIIESDTVESKSEPLTTDSICDESNCYSDRLRADLVNNNATTPALEHLDPVSDDAVKPEECKPQEEPCSNLEDHPKIDLTLSLTTNKNSLQDAEFNDELKLFKDVSELSDRLNSPILRRTLLTPESERVDCRQLFSENTDSKDESSEKIEAKKYSSLRDSLDVSKVKKLFSSPTNKEESPLFVAVSDSMNNLTLEAEKLQDESSDKFGQNSPRVTSFSPCSTQRKSKTKIGISRDRRVSFPKDDVSLTTSYEPENPWCKMNNVTTTEITDEYSKSCKRHQTDPLPVVIRQIAALPLYFGTRIECLSLRNHKLDVNQCECLEEIFRRVQFQTLIFEGCGLDDDSVIPLFDMIEFYDSAIHINISCNDKISQRGWQACARMLKRTPSISGLNAHSTSLNEQNMPVLAKALRMGAHLHTLHLENCNLTGRPLMILTGALKVNDTVTELYLADNRLGANDCIQIGNLIRSNKILRLLDLRNNNIQDTGCSHICEGIIEQRKCSGGKISELGSSSYNGLVGLVLWNNHLTIQSVPQVSLMLQSAHPLQILNLGRNNLTTEAILQLKSSLIRNYSLKQLGLQATRIGNEGGVALAEYIADNCIIERIDLRENLIQVAGLMALSQSLRINKTLIQIDLDNNMKSEPPELTMQHEALYQEIKSYCQRNLSSSQIKDSQPIKENINVKARKISLTCDSTAMKERNDLASSTNEPKKYWSPAPSPSPSPCPSPSLSPSPSPVPSPSRSRFEVFRVPEKSNSNSDISQSQSHQESLFNTPIPVSNTMPSLSCSLPSLVQSTRPNRFSTGGRFTVTRVKEEPSSFKSSLPTTRTMSSPSLIVSDAKDEPKPTIVVSSPNNPITGFYVPEDEKSMTVKKFEKVSTDDSTDPLSPHVSKISQEKTNALVSPREFSPLTNPCPDLPFKAPLALMEAESFDSDSEDSEINTQSSDSTHSDEVKIGVEQRTPMPAWEIKDESEHLEENKQP